MTAGNAIHIPSILKVKSGVLDELGMTLKEHKLRKVVLYFGDGLIELFGNRIMQSLKLVGIQVIEYREINCIDMNEIVTDAFTISNEAQVIIGIGGGKVIDASKYMAFLKKLPFISIPTSTSSDGFASASASLQLDGRRVSVPAKMAYGILVDTKVIQTAPEKFIYSGIGDMLSKITSLYDWQYEEEMGFTKTDGFAMMIAKKAVNSFVRTPYASIKEELFLKELVDSLAMSGIANEIAGSSAPVSGSEHLISHALDKLLEHPQLHGIQVGIATYIMALVQEHRSVRVTSVLQETGFFAYVRTLELKQSDFIAAIDLAPTIKPNRHTFLHEEKYREKAKEIVQTDARMCEILK